MLKINILCIGKIKEPYLKEGINEYAKRLSKYCNLNIIELPDKTIPGKLNQSVEEQIKNLEANCLEDYKEFTAFQNGLFYIRLKKDEKIYYPK